MMPLLNPGFWLVVLLAAMALFGSGYAAGSKHASSACIADQAKAQKAVQVVVDETNAHREQVAQSREVAREQIRVVYRTIKEKADESVKDNPEFNDCGLDADGLRNWNAANASAAPAMRGEPDYGLLDAATSQVWKVDRFVSEPHRSNGDVRAVPRSTQEAGGMQ